MLSYREFYDENGDETIELADYDFRLPLRYLRREVELATLNLMRGADRRDMPVSRNTLHLAVQDARHRTHGFGDRFCRDPRPFSSLWKDGRNAVA